MTAPIVPTQAIAWFDIDAVRVWTGPSYAEGYRRITEAVPVTFDEVVAQTLVGLDGSDQRDDDERAIVAALRRAADQIEARTRFCDRCGRALKPQQKRFCSRGCAHLFTWRPIRRKGIS